MQKNRSRLLPCSLASGLRIAAIIVLLCSFFRAGIRDFAQKFLAAKRKGIQMGGAVK